MCLCIFFPISNFPKILVTLLFFQFCLSGMLTTNNHQICFLLLSQRNIAFLVWGAKHQTKWELACIQEQNFAVTMFAVAFSLQCGYGSGELLWALNCDCKDCKLKTVKTVSERSFFSCFLVCKNEVSGSSSFSCPSQLNMSPQLAAWM